MPDHIVSKPAMTLEDAIGNFEPNLPLQPNPDGSPHPFYVIPPKDPTSNLEKKLSRLSISETPKYFFMGHGGCGKSTELRLLARSLSIQKKYFPIHYSIRKVSDPYDLDVKELLLSIAAQMIEEFEKNGWGIDPELKQRVDAFAGEVLQEIIELADPDRLRSKEREMTVGANLGIGNLQYKVKNEAETRKYWRQTIGINLTKLISLINDISFEIHAKTSKYPLVLVDDLDKLNSSQAKSVIIDHMPMLLAPDIDCGVVYTVPIFLPKLADFSAGTERLIVLPTIPLHSKAEPDQVHSKNLELLKSAVLLRIEHSKISSEAVTMVVTQSGGVFRWLMRITQLAIVRAAEYEARGERSLVEVEDVEYAASVIRRRDFDFLQPDDISLLSKIQNGEVSRLKRDEQFFALLSTSAIVEYELEIDGKVDPWFEVLPILGWYNELCVKN